MLECGLKNNSNVSPPHLKPYTSWHIPVHNTTPLTVVVVRAVAPARSPPVTADGPAGHARSPRTMKLLLAAAALLTREDAAATPVRAPRRGDGVRTWLGRRCPHSPRPSRDGDGREGRTRTPLRNLGRLGSPRRRRHPSRNPPRRAAPSQLALGLRARPGPQGREELMAAGQVGSVGNVTAWRWC